MIKNIQIFLKQCSLDIMFFKTKPVCVCVCVCVCVRGWLWGEVESGDGGMAVAVSVDSEPFSAFANSVLSFLVN